MRIPRNPNRPAVLPDSKRTIARTAISTLKAEAVRLRRERDGADERAAAAEGEAHGHKASADALRRELARQSEEVARLRHELVRARADLEWTRTQVADLMREAGREVTT